MSSDPNERLQLTLCQFNLTLGEYAMLSLIDYESRRATDAPGYACALFRDTRTPLPTTAACNAAIDSLGVRGLTRIVDEASQREIAKFVRLQSGYGPLEGLPFIGQLDFTIDGAQFWRELLNWSHPNFGLDYFWYHCFYPIRRRNSTVLYTFDRQWARDDVSRFTPIDNWEPIGPWRSQWWRKMPSGFRLRCAPNLE